MEIEKIVIGSNSQKYISNTFTTQKELSLAMKEIKKSIASAYGQDRDGVKIPQGFVVLYGVAKETSQLIPLTSKVGRMKDYLKNDNFKDFTLQSKELMVN